MKRQVSKNRSTLFADADNTLWDTDKVFSEAQLSLLGSIESVTSQKAPTQDRLAFVRELDQFIAEKHHARLRYPPRLLVRAVALALAGATPQVAAKMAWSNTSKNLTAIDPILEEKIEQQFFRDLKSLPQLREGVAQGLPELSILGCRIVVFTEGSREKCDLVLRHYDLRQYFDQIFEGPKNLETFRRLELLYTNAGTVSQNGSRQLRFNRCARNFESLFVAYKPRSNRIPRAGHRVLDRVQGRLHGPHDQFAFHALPGTTCISHSSRWRGKPASRHRGRSQEFHADKGRPNRLRARWEIDP